MNKIHADTTLGIHVSNGIVHIFLGNDDLSQAFYSNAKQKKDVKATNIISMPLDGFIQTINIFNNFQNEPHMKMLLKQYEDLGILKKEIKE